MSAKDDEESHGKDRRRKPAPKYRLRPVISFGPSPVVSWGAWGWPRDPRLDYDARCFPRWPRRILCSC